MRSLVADLGTDVGSCAHLTALRRTRSGRFSIDQAVTLDRLEHATLIPLADATELPRVVAEAALLFGAERIVFADAAPLPPCRRRCVVDAVAAVIFRRLPPAPRQLGFVVVVVPAS